MAYEKGLNACEQPVGCEATFVVKKYSSHCQVGNVSFSGYRNFLKGEKMFCDESLGVPMIIF